MRYTSLVKAVALVALASSCKKDVAEPIDQVQETIVSNEQQESFFDKYKREGRDNNLVPHEWELQKLRDFNDGSNYDLTGEFLDTRQQLDYNNGGLTWKGAMFESKSRIMVKTYISLKDNDADGLLEKAIVFTPAKEDGERAYDEEIVLPGIHAHRKNEVKITMDPEFATDFDMYQGMYTNGLRGFLNNTGNISWNKR
jgi:hypothetical protein